MKDVNIRVTVVSVKKLSRMKATRDNKWSDSSDSHNLGSVAAPGRHRLGERSWPRGV